MTGRDQDREGRDPGSESIQDRTTWALPPLEAGGSVSLEFEAEAEAEAEAADVTRDILRRLAKRTAAFGRYQIKTEIDHGAMGTILCAWDEDLRRHLAMKVLQQGRPARSYLSDARALCRFLEEAQITGQLEHPGIVPVHELGIGPDGRLYFTMQLVKGRTLTQIFRLTRRRRDGWTQTRALGVILRVCEAMAYAHSRDVIHRDLKPSNVMVGRFGEVYVMDWGLARVMGRADSRDLRIRDDETDVTRIVGEREASSADGGSPLVTIDGVALGTPVYMSPEQARGEVSRIGAASDVYAAGAILYELLAGCRPYLDRTGRASPRTILRWVIDGPPTPVQAVNPSLPPELVAICDTAMARDVNHRYPSMQAMADDLRAYLEHRVVRAYRTGAVAEFRKWVARNRPTAAALGVLLLVLVSAGFLVAGLQHLRSQEAIRNLHERAAAAYVAEADRLGPIHPDAAGAMKAWLAGARPLIERGARYRRELDLLRANALPYDEETSNRDRNDPETRQELDHLLVLIDMMIGRHSRAEDALTDPEADPQTRQASLQDLEILSIEVPHLQARARALEQRLEQRKTWRFASAEDQEWHDRLAPLVAAIDELSERARVVEQRLDLATGLVAATIDAHRRQWDEAIASIADPDECPLYRGLTIAPQPGLVPLGRNARSGLWEFWHVLSGDAPARDEEGSLRVEPRTGIVLVLLPGGEFLMGALSGPSANHDPEAQPAEGPVHPVRLDPFFIARHEMTQAQWLRATGEMPSENFPGLQPRGSPRISRTHPVEHVSWEECRDVLRRWSLTIPTEAQWEYAARGGTDTPYWSGTDQASIASSANFLDQSTAGLSTTERRMGPGELAPYHDGYSHHAPVDAYAPNPFGLHNVLGNVWEWTRDMYSTSYSPKAIRDIDPHDGLHRVTYSNAVTCRGGGFESPLLDLRVSRRYKRLANSRDEDIGVRPGRSLDPGPGIR